MSSISDGAQTTTAKIPTPFDELTSAIEQLRAEVSSLHESIVCSHAKLYGDYNFPPSSEKDEQAKEPGRVSILTGNIQRIRETVRITFEVAESIEQKS